MEKNEENYSITMEEINRLKKILDEKKELKKKMDNEMGFEVPDYVVEEIYEEAYYRNICLLINVAVINERITEENSKKLKKSIKDKYNIKNMYDRCVFKE